MFTPIRTERLLIRPVRLGDAESLAERRSDPKVAALQSWTVPFPLEKAQSLVEGAVLMDGPADDEWWMAIITDAESGTTYGDLALRLSWGGRSAEVGYTLAAEHWGHGYATEALRGFLTYLFNDVGVHRVMGMLHPDNVASARVLERCGFLFEGQTRQSYWVADEVSDDVLYGLVRDDWETWQGRSTTTPEQVRLVEVVAENVRQIYQLRTHRSQERFVAPMGLSFAQALVPELVDGYPVVPWMRAIEAEREFVGFVMLALHSEHHPEPYLWRLLIDRSFQGRGIGSMAMDLVEAECRKQGDGALLVSWVAGRGSPAPFYLRRGFEPTGRIVDGEIEARKPLV